MYQSGVIALYLLVVQKIELRVEKYHCEMDIENTHSDINDIIN